MRRTQGPIAAQDSHQIGAAADTLFMNGAQGAGHVAAVFLAGCDAPFGLDGLLGRAIFAGLGMADTDFQIDNGCKSRGQVPCVDLLAVTRHPNLNVPRSFFVHVGIVHRHRATSMGLTGPQDKARSHQGEDGVGDSFFHNKSV